MSTVRAPYPSKMDTINGKSVTSMIRTPTTVTFKNRAGVSVGPFTIRNTLPTSYVQCLRNIGAFDADYRDVLIKGWDRPQGTASEVTVFSSKVRTNMVPNPSFEVDLSNWTPGSGTTATRDATYHPSGGWAMKLVNGSTGPSTTSAAINVIAGTEYHFMAVILASDGTPGPGLAKVITVTWRNSSNATISTSTTGAVTPPIAPIQLTATAPAGATNCLIQLATGSFGTWYIDSVLMEKTQAGADTTYFDGGTTNTGTRTYAWTGTANNSPSTETPAGLPAGVAWKAAWSPDGKYLAVLTSVASGLYVYKRDKDTFTALAAPAYSVTGGNLALAWSADGQYLFCGSTGTPKFVIFKRSGDVLTKLSDPAYMPTSNVTSASWSSDNTYVAVGIAVSPYVVFYKRAGDVFTKLSDPASLPPSAINDVSFSPGTRYVAVVHTSSPYLTVYKRTGDTFAKLTAPSVIPDGGCVAVAFAPNGRYLAVDNGSSVIAMYKRSGDVFTRMASPVDITGFAINGLAWTPDSNYLACLTNYNQPYFFLYKRNGDTLVMRNGLTTRPPGGVNGGKFSPDGKHLALACDTTPYLVVYKSQMSPVAGAAVRLVADTES